MQLIDSDGITSSYFKEEDGYGYCKTVQEVTPIIEQNTLLRNNRNDKREANLTLVGSVPITQHYEWRREYIRDGYSKAITWETFLMQRLASREFSKFRSTDKKLWIPRSARA